MTWTGLHLRRTLRDTGRGALVALIDRAIAWLDPTPQAAGASPPASPPPPPDKTTTSPPPPAAGTPTSPPPPAIAPAAEPAAAKAAASPPLSDAPPPAASEPAAPSARSRARAPSKPRAPRPAAEAAPPTESTAEDRQRRHWERTRRGVLAFVADQGGSASLRDLHAHSEATWFVAHVSFSRLMEELTGEGLLSYDHDARVASLTDAGRALLG